VRTIHDNVERIKERAQTGNKVDTRRILFLKNFDYGTYRKDVEYFDRVRISAMCL
jgi:hypothetical protein